MNQSLSAINGLLVGHFSDTKAITGCTVILCPEGAVAGVDVRGAAPGTRETDLLHPINTIQKIHGLLLTGGSAYGLAAADGVMQWLEEQGIGFNVGVGVVPIVPAAVLFDLTIGRADIRPGMRQGYLACQQATNEAVAEGSVGAGTGATVGKLFGPSQATKSGLGTASRQLAQGVKVAAMAVINAFGDVIDPQTNQVMAGPRQPDHLPDTAEVKFIRTMDYLCGDGGNEGVVSQTRLSFAPNTSLAVVATEANLTKAEANKVAQMAHDGLARTIDPIHTMFDGDTIFALATGKTNASADVSLIGAVAASVLAEAVLRAIKQATGLGGIPARADLVRLGE